MTRVAELADTLTKRLTDWADAKVSDNPHVASADSSNIDPIGEQGLSFVFAGETVFPLVVALEFFEYEGIRHLDPKWLHFAVYIFCRRAVLNRIARLNQMEDARSFLIAIALASMGDNAVPFNRCRELVGSSLNTMVALVAPEIVQASREGVSVHELAPYQPSFESPEDGEISLPDVLAAINHVACTGEPFGAATNSVKVSQRIVQILYEEAPNPPNNAFAFTSLDTSPAASPALGQYILGATCSLETLDASYHQADLPHSAYRTCVNTLLTDQSLALIGDRLGCPPPNPAPPTKFLALCADSFLTSDKQARDLVVATVEVLAGPTETLLSAGTGRTMSVNVSRIRKALGHPNNNSARALTSFEPEDLIALLTRRLSLSVTSTPTTPDLSPLVSETHEEPNPASATQENEDIETVLSSPTPSVHLITPGEPATIPAINAVSDPPEATPTSETLIPASASLNDPLSLESNSLGTSLSLAHEGFATRTIGKTQSAPALSNQAGADNVSYHEDLRPSHSLPTLGPSSSTSTLPSLASSAAVNWDHFDSYASLSNADALKGSESDEFPDNAPSEVSAPSQRAAVSTDSVVPDVEDPANAIGTDNTPLLENPVAGAGASEPAVEEESMAQQRGETGDVSETSVGRSEGHSEGEGGAASADDVTTNASSIAESIAPPPGDNDVAPAPQGSFLPSDFAFPFNDQESENVVRVSRVTEVTLTNGTIRRRLDEWITTTSATHPESSSSASTSAAPFPPTTPPPLTTTSPSTPVSRVPTTPVRQKRRVPSAFDRDDVPSPQGSPKKPKAPSPPASPPSTD